MSVVYHYKLNFINRYFFIVNHVICSFILVEEYFFTVLGHVIFWWSYWRHSSGVIDGWGKESVDIILINQVMLAILIWWYIVDRILWLWWASLTTRLDNITLDSVVFWSWFIIWLSLIISLGGNNGLVIVWLHSFDLTLKVGWMLDPMSHHFFQGIVLLVDIIVWITFFNVEGG